MATISFSGLASGIDSDALIKATSDATRSQRVTPLETKVTNLTDTDTALEEFKTKLTSLQTATRKFSSTVGGGLVKQGVSSDETVLTTTASNAAINATYSVTVSALATNGTISLGPAAGTYASDSATISAGVSEVITIGSGSTTETITVPITAGSTTIAQFVTSFNNQSTMARASLVNIGTTASPNYKIVINSNKTGTAEGTITVDTNAAGFAAPTTSAATDASFSISGIGTITRPSNTINDVIAGLTLDLRTAGTSTISVTDDVTSSTTVVQEMVDAWNEIVNFVKEKNEVTREEDGSGVTNVFGALSLSRVDDNALTSLRTALSSISASVGSEIRIFADIGFKTERDGTLSFNTDTFKSAMANEPLSVGEILTDFADKVSLTADLSNPTQDGVIHGFIKFGGMIDITINSNKSQITDLNRRISDAEALIAKNEEAMKRRFAQLESTISKLQSQQSSLTSALAGLG